MKWRIPISQKLVISFLLLGMISASIVGFYSYRKAKTALMNRTFDQLISLRTEKTNRLKEFFARQQTDVKQISQMVPFKQWVNSLSEQKGSKEKYSIQFPYLSIDKRVIIVDPKGFAICCEFKGDTLSEFQKLDDKDLKKIQQLWNELKFSDKTVIREVKPGIFSANSNLFVCQIIGDLGSSKSGMVLFEIPRELLNQIMVENNPHNGLGETGETYLVGSDYFMRSNSRFLKINPNAIKVDTRAVHNAFEQGSGIDQMPDYRNIPVLSAYSKLDVPGLNWVILAEIDVREAMIPIYTIRNNIIYLLIIILLFLLGLVVILSSMITAPIKKLKFEAEQITHGNYGKTINQTSNDEIGDLVMAFNQMTLKLKEQAVVLDQERNLRMASMVDGQELERQRLSRELHDGLGQLVLAINMKLERALQVDPETARVIISETSHHFKSIVAEIRNISNNLMPAVLNEFGLITGLRNLASETSAQSGVKVEFLNQTNQESFGKRIDTYLYRLAQEAVINALKHADATQIDIKISEEKNKIVISIRDNGCGFDYAQKEPVKGNGILNMKERVHLLGGEFRLLSEPGKGTDILAIIPLNKM